MDKTEERGLVRFIEACEILCMHQNTGYEMLREGRFPVDVVEVGRRYFCRRREIERFLDGPPRPVVNGAVPAGDPCPVCKRYFRALPRHMAARHPEELAVAHEQ